MTLDPVSPVLYTKWEERKIEHAFCLYCQGTLQSWKIDSTLIYLLWTLGSTPNKTHDVSEQLNHWYERIQSLRNVYKLKLHYNCIYPTLWSEMAVRNLQIAFCSTPLWYLPCTWFAAKESKLNIWNSQNELIIIKT